MINYDYTNWNKDVNLLKIEREKLVSLIKKVDESHQEMIDANLSGETYENVLANCEYFSKKLNTRLSEVDNIITLMENIAKNYENVHNDISQRVGG